MVRDAGEVSATLGSRSRRADRARISDDDTLYEQVECEGAVVKTCSKCKVEKPLEEFHKAKRRSDGRDIYCALCRNLASKFYWAANKKAILAKQQARRAERLEAALTYSRTYWVKNKEKYNAKRASNRAMNRELFGLRDAAYRTANAERISRNYMRHILRKKLKVVPEAMVEVRHLINRIKSFNRERKEQ